MGFAGERLQREGAAAAAGFSGSGLAERRVGGFLRERVPFAAGFALALPARIGRAAILADEGLAFANSCAIEALDGVREVNRFGSG